MIVDLSKINSGFSDKLRAVTFYIAINNLNSKKSKIFHIFEKKTKECPFRFSDYCEIKNIKIIKLKNKRASTINLNSYNTEITIKNVAKNNPFKLISNQVLFEEWKKSYKKIMPGKKLKQKLKKNNLPKNSLGLHLRTTDRTIKFSKILNIQFKDTIFNFQLEFFKRNIYKILQNNYKFKNIYIAADSKNIKDFIISSLKETKYNIYYNDLIFKKGFRKTSGEDFLIDFFSLSKCEIILSTVGAGVTQSIFLIKGRKIINWNNQFNRFFLVRFLSLFIIFLKKIKTNCF